MKPAFIISCFLLLFPVTGFGQSFNSVDAAWIEHMHRSNSDTLYVINFWATWCKPCVAELPEFDKIQNAYASKPVKVILVSNDMRKNIEQKLSDFLKDRQVKSTVYWMNEPDANTWINLVDSSWSGAIPATWVIQPNRKFHYFKEGEINFEQLKQVVDSNVK